MCAPGLLREHGAREAGSGARAGGGAGSGLRRLTHDRLQDDGAAWPPDGTRIAYEHSRLNAGEGGIWVMRADGTHAHRLSNGHDSSPSWSADSSRLVPVWRP
jgi:Tol biopolymer transport system component